MKKKIGLFLILVLFIVILSVSTALAKGVMYYTYTINSDNTVTITGYKGESALYALPAGTYYEAGESIERPDLVIPSTLGGIRVTAIEEKAFEGLNKYDTIVIPNSVIQIEGNPFINCGGIKEYVVADGNPNLYAEDGILFDKAGKRLISFPTAKKLEDYIIPDFVEIIETKAFSNTKLKSIIIPESVKDIRQYAFECSGFISGLEKIELSDGLEEIGDYAFNGCAALRSIRIPSSVRSIGVNPFCGCNSIVLSLDEGNQSFSLENSALIRNVDHALIATSCIREDPYYVPEGVITICADSFTYGYSHEIVLPEGLQVIEHDAFRNYTQETHFVIPDSVSEIGQSAFPANIYFPFTYDLPEAFTSTHDKEWMFEYNDYQLRMLNWGVSGEAVLEKYVGSNQRVKFDGFAFVEGCQVNVTGTASGVFANNKSIREVYFYLDKPDIPDRMFYNCSNLETITIGQLFPDEYMLSIGKEAFAGCKRLKTIILNCGTSEISDDAFDGCNPDVNWELSSYLGDNTNTIQYINSKNQSYSLDGVPQPKVNSNSEVSTDDGLETCLFGRYEQDNDLENGPESIKWIVLDRREDAVLLISADVLDIINPYIKGSDTWEDGGLRKWLNEDFYQVAFTEDEKDKICLTRVAGETSAPIYNPGNDTVDKVFALDVSELSEYMEDIPQAVLPSFSSYTQAILDERYADERIGWLTRDLTNGYATWVLAQHYYGSGGDEQGVRPSIWIQKDAVDK